MSEENQHHQEILERLDKITRHNCYGDNNG
jgi:hypothetical protein